MEMQVLTPAMQHREEAGLYAQTFGIASNGEQRLRGSAEEDRIDGLFVVKSEVGDGLWEGEDHVEVFHGQQLGFSLLQPLGALQPLALGPMAVEHGTILVF